jgi:hypothetical protein
MHFSSLLSLAAVTGFSLPYTSAAVLPRQATNGSAELTFYPVNGPSDGVKLTGVRDATSGTDAYTSIPYAKPRTSLLYPSNIRLSSFACNVIAAQCCTDLNSHW